MTREVCGMCWCPYGDDGRCACPVEEVSSKPLAWMYQIHDITGWTWVIDQRLPDYEYRNEKPLYTHPVKQLSDEEIWEIINRTAWVGTEEEIRFKIANAIIKEITE